MWSNLPDFSMKGSGIDSYTIELYFSCRKELDDGKFCDFQDDVTAWVDDWNEVSVECPKCESKTDLGNVREVHL